jgi:hypothetical protein
MSVYVDDGHYRHGFMTMCHMTADSYQELTEMAERLGLKEKWLQKPGAVHEHFDICKAKRIQAVALGAIEETERDGVKRRIAARKER